VQSAVGMRQSCNSVNMYVHDSLSCTVYTFKSNQIKSFIDSSTIIVSISEIIQIYVLKDSKAK